MSSNCLKTVVWILTQRRVPMIRGSRILCTVLLILVSMGLHAQTATWSSTGSMTEARYGHTATVLSDGKVLVVGNCTDSSSGNCLLGNTKQATNTAELYDPATGTWTSIAAMKSARFGHTATLLSDGKVLVAGGVSSSGIIGAAEVYDPVAKTWTATGAMKAARFGHTATLLRDGTVLVTGGTSGGYTSLAPLNTAELYDPASGTWTSAAAMTGTRFGHTAVLLPDSGKVLVVGGLASFTLAGLTAASTAELYDPGTSNWSSAGTLVTGRFIHTTSLLPNGQVLAAGGAGSNNQLAISPMASAELYDPGTNQWVATTALKNARISHTATVLKNGQVLVVGGTGPSGILASAELYDPSGKSWADADPLKDARMTHIAALLNNGQVMVAGGTNGTDYLKSVELYGTGTVASSTLTISVIGNGSVSDNQSPPKISACTAGGGTCSGTYDSGTPVTLTATADTGYVFTSWSGDCSGASPTATVTMDANRTCTATFTTVPPPTQTHALTVTVNGSGSVSDNQSPPKISACTAGGSTCNGTYDSGTPVTLTATAGAGYTFSAWGGSCSGTSPSVTVTMDADRTCTATFTISPPLAGPTLTISVTGEGKVNDDNQLKIIACTVRDGVCSGSYASGTPVILTATAGAGYTFSTWGGDCASAGTSPTATVTMDTDHTCTATFTISPPLAGPTLTISVIGNGSVSDNQLKITNCTTAGGVLCTGTYGSGTPVTLTATADTGYVFASWSGDCFSTSPTTIVTMNADHSCTATFTVSQSQHPAGGPWYTVISQAVPQTGGTITPANQSSTQDIGAQAGDTPLFVITPDPGWALQTVSAAGCMKQSGAVTLTATGGTITGGTLSSTPNVVTALTTTDYSNRSYFQLNPVTKTCLLYAYFTKSYPYEVVPKGVIGGTVSPVTARDNDLVWFNTNGSVAVSPSGFAEFAVKANPGFTVTNLSNSCSGSSATVNGVPYSGGPIAGNGVYRIGPISRTCMLVPTFTQQGNVRVGIVTGYGGSSSSRQTGGTAYISGAGGSQIQTVLVANPGYALSRITDSCDLGSGAYNSLSKVYTTGRLTGSGCSITANFVLGRPWALQANVTAVVVPLGGSAVMTGGAIDPAAPVSIDVGDSTSFVITPDPGYTPHIDSTCGGTLGGLANDIFTTGLVYGDCTVTVTFTP
jgi:uncharacterized repeat protein (TIGR02543 family)